MLIPNVPLAKPHTLGGESGVLEEVAGGFEFKFSRIINELGHESSSKLVKLEGEPDELKLDIDIAAQNEYEELVDEAFPFEDQVFPEAIEILGNEQFPTFGFNTTTVDSDGDISLYVDTEVSREDFVDEQPLDFFIEDFSILKNEEIYDDKQTVIDVEKDYIDPKIIRSLESFFSVEKAKGSVPLELNPEHQTKNTLNLAEEIQMDDLKYSDEKVLPKHKAEILSANPIFNSRLSSHGVIGEPTETTSKAIVPETQQPLTEETRLEAQTLKSEQGAPKAPAVDRVSAENIPTEILRVDREPTSVSFGGGLEARIVNDVSPVISPKPAANFAPQISAKIVEAVPAAADGPIEIILDPEELGKLRMQITRSEAGWTLHVAIERPETLEFMRRHLETLQKDLVSVGYEALSLQLGSGQNDRAGAQGQSGTMSGQSDTVDDGVAQTITTIAISDGLDIRV